MSTQDNDYAFLLVPGSFATPAAYAKLLDKLRAQGENVEIIELLSVNDGSRQPPATMQDDAAHIRQAVLSILDDPSAPKNVIVAPHSYSGIPTTCALESLNKEARASAGKSTAVTGIIYLASFVLSEGECLRGIMGEFGALQEPLKTGVPGGYLPPFTPELAQLVFNDLDTEEALEFLGFMSLHASDSYNGEVSYAAWKDIPSVTVIPSIDIVVPTPMQEAMYERAVKADGKIERVLVEGAGHGLPVSRLDTVIKEMLKLARRG
ncbi:Alpha/beta hydrolase fold-1 [Penicillium waksmanii]|uniref:Alpha/beta hydrolase fold-1 n=1 Tax=Penicillium waksmanii TaxID=69791 RepID=UPI0025495784|nr:Alpha/beta hydrolase fold-1 [Penicillium waksmanii]KAJ5983039.1 Alpha/beta hydrolase fold-1 [Penicillium waksmanii]